MSSESGQRLPMEELKRRNAPQTMIPQNCPSKEEWQELLHRLDELERHTAAHTALLREASSRREPCPTQAQMDAAREEAEELLATWQSGEATEDSFAALAQEHSADTGSAANGGLITGISASSGYVETFADWALDPSRQPGDTGIVQNTGSSTKGWHIMYYVSAGDPIWKQTAFSAMQSEDYDQLLADIDESVTAQEGLGMKLVSGR